MHSAGNNMEGYDSGTWGCLRTVTVDGDMRDVVVIPTGGGSRP